jgi:hypothetical protein
MGNAVQSASATRGFPNQPDAVLEHRTGKVLDRPQPKFATSRSGARSALHA